jgi:hypothetical protein
MLSRRRVPRERGTPAHSKRGATFIKWRRSCSVLARRSARLRRAKYGANLWKDTVELLAATAILGLSVGCGLAAARVALESIFSLMTFHSAFHDVSSAPLPMELPYETQLRLATAAA